MTRLRLPIGTLDDGARLVQYGRMSIDCEVWIRRPHELSVALYAVSENWQQETDGELVLDGDEWQLLVTPPEEVDGSNADPNLATALADRIHVVYVTLEGNSDGLGCNALAKAVRLVVERCGGVSLDPDSGDLLAAE